MSLTEPQALTIAGAAQSLPRVGSGVNSGSFKTNDGLVALDVSSAYGKRTRRTVRLSHAKVAADPFVPTQNARYSMSTYIVMDTPNTGYTVAQQKEVIDAFVAWLAASSGANVTKVLGGES